MSIQGGVMQYVLCPGCGDPVAGRLPTAGEDQKLTCAHCRTTFPFKRQDVRSGVVLYDEKTGRWNLGKPTVPR